MRRWAHDAPQPPPSARRRPVPHRRRDRDHADLPRGSRPARCSRRSTCSRTTRGPTRCAATSSPTPRSRASAASASSSRARPGGRARAGPRRSATRRDAARRAQPQGDRADGGDPRARTRRRRRPIVISGCVGPHDDGYDPAEKLTAAAAEDYHSTQIDTFADTAADMVTAITMTYTDEAIGVTRAAAAAGHAGGDLVHRRDRRPAAQRRSAGRGDRGGRRGDRRRSRLLHDQLRAPDALRRTSLARRPAWRERIRGLRANASTKSHAELDEATELDAGDPADLGARYAGCGAGCPHLNVLGGCCGTDHRHVEAISEAWV